MFNNKKILQGCLASCLFLVLLSPNVHAGAGCCSHHGGVGGCNNTTGYSLCNDGTSSPSCGCSGNIIKKTKVTKYYNYNSGKAVKATQTRSATIIPVKKPSNKGCCSRHGGVGRCNKSSGFKMCKDGSVSSCACH